MRLQDFEINSIKSTVSHIFGDGSKVILFGSRVYNDVKGGDIDLYTLSGQIFGFLGRVRYAYLYKLL